MTSSSVQTAGLSPLVRDAAGGVMPPWSRLGERRLAHVRRVAGLMHDWAVALRLSEADVVRWTAAGWLHDALREADPEEMRAQVEPAFRTLPPKLLHGPAAAARLDGHADGELREAIRFHTLGSPRWGTLGRALYLADFMEPGRTWDPDYTAALRARMPGDMKHILAEVVRSRVDHIRSNGGVPHPETEAFHAQVVEAHP